MEQMTAERAIKVIEVIRSRYDGLKSCKDCFDALNMAISALEKQVGKEVIHHYQFFGEHDWVRDEDGNIDEFAMESDYHNGPCCRRCWKSFCVCCNPNGYEEKDCKVEEDVCPTCGKSLYIKQKYCDCGQKLIWPDQDGQKGGD